MIESSKQWIVSAALVVGGCSSPGGGGGGETEASGTDTGGTGTGGTETGGPSTPGSSTHADGSTSSSSGVETSTAASSSSGGADSESTEGIVADCGEGEPGLLFGTAENIGTIPHPSGGAFLWGMQSWYDRTTGDIAESAEDFEVPAGSCWCITSVNVNGQFVAEPRSPELTIAFYEDVDGLPVESPWVSEAHEPTTSTPLQGFESPVSPVSHIIDLDGPVLVPPGRAWVSMIGHVVGSNRFSLNLSTDTFGNLSTAYRRAPSCPEWQHVDDCYPNLPAAEVAFELHGWAIACE